MNSPALARRVTIILHRPGGSQGYLKVLDRLRAEGATHVVVFRTLASILPDGHVEAARLAELVPDLPAVLLWIDSAETVDRVLPLVRPLIEVGTVTIEDADVEFLGITASPDIPEAVTVGEVMTSEVVAVNPDTPVSELILDLVNRNFRAVPVVDAEHRVVGIVTNGDLVRRGGLSLRLDLLKSLDTPALHEQLAQMTQPHRETSEVMTANVITTTPETGAQEAADIMIRRHLKRLPVVDREGRLLGIVSRVDLLRTVAPNLICETGDAPSPAVVSGDTPVSQIMSHAAPVVSSQAPVSEVLNTIVSTRLNRAVVVDELRHVEGIVSDADAVARLTPQARPGAFAVLMRRIVHRPGGNESEALRNSTRGQTARDLMRTDVVIVHEEDRLGDVLEVMLSSNHKVIPVVNAGEELTGIIDRADLLRLLVQA